MTGSEGRAWLPVTTLPVPVTVCAASTRVSKRPCDGKQLQRPSTVEPTSTEVTKQRRLGERPGQKLSSAIAAEQRHFGAFSS